MTLSATIIIPTYNRAALLRAALESICALRLPTSIDVNCVVIDNNSTDATAEIVELTAQTHAAFPIRRVVETRQGLNHGRNRGLSESTGDWTVFLDDDMLVEAGWLCAFDNAIRTTSPDIVTGPVVPMFESAVPKWCVPHVLDSVTSSYSQRGSAPRELSANEQHEIPGCNFAVRTELARRVGGFHPALDRAGSAMLAGGDTEFAMRVADGGGTALYVPECRIRHLVSSTKVSRAGLLARWRGLGSTEKKIRELHQLRPTLSPWRARLRSLRFRSRYWRLSLMGQPEAFRWRLEAERLEHSI